LVKFIQDLFLSPFLIIVILIAVFIGLSWWAIQRRKEYIGYGLGWLIGVFFMVIYGALVGDPEPVAQAEEVVPETLNILQVIIPSFIGIGFGIGAMLLVAQTHQNAVGKSIAVAILTAMSLVILFLMLVSSAYPVNQRMIGLFALAFAIGAVTTLAIARQVPPRPHGGTIPPVQPTPQQNGIPTVPISTDEADSFRERIRRR